MGLCLCLPDSPIVGAVCRAPGVGDADFALAHHVQGSLFPSAHLLAFLCHTTGTLVRYGVWPHVW